MIQNPYRKGKAAGLAYYAAFEAYRLALRGENPLPRPELPANPYPVPPPGARAKGRNGGRYQWDDGFRHAKGEYEASKRAGRAGGGRYC